MSPLAIALAFAAVVDSARPLDLDRLGVDQARTLDGRPVVVAFIIGKPLDVWRGRTVVGGLDHPDGAERVALVAGKRLELEPGQRVRVVGTMRVIHHPPTVVGAELVPGWWEIRVTGFQR